MSKQRTAAESKAVPTNFVEIVEAIKERIAELTVSHQHEPAATAHLEPIAQLLESLPLAAHEFGVAQARVSNARRYFQSKEIGAARYELRLLLGQLNAAPI